LIVLLQKRTAKFNALCCNLSNAVKMPNGCVPALDDTNCANERDSAVINLCFICYVALSFVGLGGPTTSENWAYQQVYPRPS
jgi:hypothetical protein